MIYHILQKLIWWTLCLAYRRLYVKGKFNIPKQGRVLIAMNHPAGFLEPITLAGIYHRPLHYLVRGDVFKKAWLAPILRATNQHPIYRFRDGFEDMKRNMEQMQRIGHLLQQGHPILVYVEGSTAAVKKLRPLQKGLARLAHSCLEQDSTSPLYILPVGISFTDSTKLQEDVMVSIGKPIDARDYYPTLQGNKNKGIRQITSDTRDAIRRNMVHLERREDEALQHDLVSMTIPYFSTWWPRYVENSMRLDTEINIAEKLNNLPEAKRSALKEDIEKLRGQLVASDLRPLAQRHLRWWEVLLLVLGALPALLGVALHLLPLAGAKAFVAAKVKEPVFQGALLAVLLMVCTLLFYLIVGIVAAVSAGIYSLVVLATMAVLGLWALRYSYLVRRLQLWWRGRKVTPQDLAQADLILQKIGLSRKR